MSSVDDNPGPTVTRIRRGGWRWGLAALLGLGLAGAVFLVARGREGPPDPTAPPRPALPRVALDPAQVRGAEEALARRLIGVQPTEDEARFLDALSLLEAAEVTAGDPAGDPAGVQARLKITRELALPLAAADLDRYLLLGDLVAARFTAALRDLRRALADGRGDPAAREAARRAFLPRGGSWLVRAEELGLLAPDGSLTVSEIVPGLLMRLRHRTFADLEPEIGLTPIERLAHLDFVVAFSRPVQAERRLQAIGRIELQDRAYDAPLARALVLDAAGRSAEAREIIEGSLRVGRQSPGLVALGRILAPAESR